MTNTDLLLDRIKESGLRRNFLAQRMGLSSYGLALKIQNVNEFKASEIDQLCELLQIDDLAEKEAIFFAKEVDL